MTRTVLALLAGLLLLPPLAGCAGPVPVAAAPDNAAYPRPGGDPRQNAAALQQVIDQAQPGVPFRIDLGPGQYEIAAAIRVPADRYVVIDGGGVAQLYRTGYGPVFTLTPADQWGRGRFVLQNFWAISGQVTTDGPVQLNRPKITGCAFYPSKAYGIDFATGYCVQPYIGDCDFKGFGGGVRWRYHRANPEGVPHASSGIVIERCRMQSDASACPGPAVWLEGHHQLTVRNVICEGATAGWVAGIDPAEFGYTAGVFVDAPGPRGGSLESVWCEFWNYTPAGPAACDVLVRNPYSGSAGAYQSGPFRLADVSGSGPVRVAAVPDALNVARVEVRGGDTPVGEGPVIIRRWLTGGLEDRAKATKAPVWAWN